MITVGLLTFYLIWIKSAILATILSLFLILLIERTINTSYTFTSDKKLLINKGRFYKTKEILLNEVVAIEKLHGPRIGKFSFVTYLLIKCTDGKGIAVTPTKELEFINYMHKKRVDI